LKFVHTADSHLGYQFTRVARGHPEGREKRARGIFENFLAVVNHAHEIEADVFIHSGDLFNKTYIPREILDELAWPLVNLARRGTPVLIIPGNHEKSEFPFDLFHGASGVFVFDRPKSLLLTLGGYSVGFAGFPFIRNDSKRTFLTALEETEYKDLRSDLNVLVTHQTFDQAVVGPGDFVFSAGRQDTVSRNTVPVDFDYVAAGHIHRYQVLFHPLNAGIHFVYPGSTQRMSFAEMDEEKGFVEGEVLHDRIETRFIPLPAHDMEIIEIEAAGMTEREVEDAVTSHFWRFEENRVIRFQFTGAESTRDYPDVDFERIRAQMPSILECQFVLRAGKRVMVK